MSPQKGYGRVVFDEGAYAVDTVRSGRTGADVLRQTRVRFEREGVVLADLRDCESEGRDGTRLPGCLKVYLPAPDGRFGMVLILARDEHGLALHYLAFGVRHHPRESNAPSVYQLADRRLNG